MDKFAQRRGIFNKLHEAFSPSGNAAEKFFNPEFKKVMDGLRLNDDNIRSIAIGEKIGGGNPGSDTVGLKQLVKSAKSNLNRREYITAISDLGRFHAKLVEITKEIHALNGTVDEVHHQFLYKHLLDNDNETPEENQRREEHLKHLRNLKTRLAKEQQEYLVKQAGIMDFFYNIGTRRGRALAAWEKRYPNETSNLKSLTKAQVELSEKILGETLESLKVMAQARAARNVDTYISTAHGLSKRYDAYDASFKQFYGAKLDKLGKMTIKGLLEKMFPEEAVETAPKEEPKTENKPGEVPQVPDLVVPPPSSSGPSSEPPPSTPTPGGVEHSQESAPPTIPDLNVPTGAPPASAPPGVTVHQLPNSGVVGKVPHANDNEPQLSLPLGTAHAKFYKTLESLSGESPAFLAKYISKYATSIQETDPTTAIKLLKIATRIRG